MQPSACSQPHWSTLTAGESLVVPRRTVHSARSTAEGFSVHVTLGEKPSKGRTCVTRLSGALEGGAAEARRLTCTSDDHEFLTGCPVGQRVSPASVFPAGPILRSESPG